MSETVKRKLEDDTEDSVKRVAFADEVEVVGADDSVAEQEAEASESEGQNDIESAEQNEEKEDEEESKLESEEQNEEPNEGSVQSSGTDQTSTELPVESKLEPSVESVLKELAASAGQSKSTPDSTPYNYQPKFDTQPKLDPEPKYDSYEPIAETFEPRDDEESDPTYTQIRMYCPVKEASAVVGKKGEKINHIRAKANVKINVSENIKGIPDRIVTVKGSAENVARAFGLIARAILEEPEDVPASIHSKLYHLKVLLPHPLVGYVIGKLGSKFREIEENSAAKLKAAEQALPYSTDRILSITGVADAIHIAVYFVAQVVIEHKDILKKHKIVYYNPTQDGMSRNSEANPMLGRNDNMVGNLVNLPTTGILPQNVSPNTLGNLGTLSSGYPAGNLSSNTLGNSLGNTLGSLGNYSTPYSGQYNFLLMYQQQPQQPSVPVSNFPANQFGASNNISQSLYKDEYGNTIVGDVITSAPVPAASGPDKFNEDIYVSNTNIGSVIGRGGNNIKHIRENSGCTYVRIEPDRNQSLMIGGKGLTNIRKLTLTGTILAIQSAVMLINQRIAADKERNSVN